MSLKCTLQLGGHCRALMSLGISCIGCSRFEKDKDSLYIKGFVVTA